MHCRRHARGGARAGAIRGRGKPRARKILRPRDLGHRTARRTRLPDGFQPAPRPRLAWQGTDIMTRIDNARVIRAPRGNQLSAKSWLTEAPMRMLMNNLDPDVAEKPNELVVYGGLGRAGGAWGSFERTVPTLKRLEGDETLLVQSGKPVGVFRTHADAPRVLIANSN